MKYVLTGLLAVILHLGASNIHAIESKVVEIETTHGTRVSVQSLEVEKLYQTLVAAEVETLSQKATASEKIYAFAFSSQGMDMDRHSAQDFTEKMVEVAFSNEAIATLKDAALYAFSSQGLDLPRQSVRAFVEKLMPLSGSAERLRIHKKAYAFAFSSQGMDLSRAEALKYANAKAGIPIN